VDEANPALLRERDRQARFGDGIHRRADDGDIDFDISGQTRSRVRFRGDHVREARQKKDVVECKRFGDGKVDHLPLNSK